MIPHQDDAGTCEEHLKSYRCAVVQMSSERYDCLQPGVSSRRHFMPPKTRYAVVRNISLPTHVAVNYYLHDGDRPGYHIMQDS
jgi:hypothetical protein